jgi:hypothetical protein
MFFPRLVPVIFSGDFVFYPWCCLSLAGPLCEEKFLKVVAFPGGSGVRGGSFREGGAFFNYLMNQQKTGKWKENKVKKHIKKMIKEPLMKS